MLGGEFGGDVSIAIDIDGGERVARPQVEGETQEASVCCYSGFEVRGEELGEGGV